MNPYIESIVTQANESSLGAITDITLAITGCLIIVFILYGIFRVKEVIARASGSDQSERIVER
jgi:hypothetical protein